MKKSDFQYILSLLKRYGGWEFNDYHYFIIDKKIYNIVREKGYATVEELIGDLKLGQKSLVNQVVEALAMSDTWFYRDYNVYKGFENYILPQMREVNRGTKRLRIWSVGCSTGQETYSIAMGVKDKLSNAADWDISILGTDISTASIQKAQKGRYSLFEVQMGLNAQKIINNFYFDANMWQINEDLIKMVTFRRFNILDEFNYDEKYDIIFCRNILRFFDKVSQSKIIEKIYKKQYSGGYLYVGTDERIENIDSYYTRVNGLPCLYQARVSEELISPSVSAQNSTDDSMPSFRRPTNLGVKRPLLSDTFNKK